MIERGAANDVHGVGARKENRQRHSFISPPPALTRTDSVQHALRNNALLSPFVGGTPKMASTSLMNDRFGHTLPRIIILTEACSLACSSFPVHDQ